MARILRGIGLTSPQRLHYLRSMAEIRSNDQFRDGYEDGLVPLEPLDLTKIHSFSDLLRAYQKASFGARRLGKAFDVMCEMASDPDCFVVCTLTGAMTVAKMGLVICEMIERGYIDLIVSTGALQAHGMIEGSGMKHFKHDPSMNDVALFDKGYDRVYDTLELEQNLDEVEIIVREVLDGLAGGSRIGSAGICSALGKHLLGKFPDQRGVLKSAYQHNVPVIIPAFTDSELGLDVAVNNEIRRNKMTAEFVFDPFMDLQLYADLVHDRERLGIFTIGGGVPRNWAQQIGPYLEIRQHRTGTGDGTTQRFRYAVRICPEPDHFGGLSGCTYTEGVSWGKFVPESEGGRHAEVFADATLVWPMLIKAVMETVPQKAKKSP